MEQFQIDAEILNSIVKIEPERSVDRSILRLLEREVIKRITKYQLMIHGFEKKYCITFDEFEMGIKKSKPAFAEDQDYYDWDMATTALEDMEQELKKVRIHLEKRD